MRLIDADALNAYIESAECNSVGKALQAIDQMPTVSPDEVRGVGKWIEDEEQNNVELTFHCSECGRKAVGRFEKTRYCGDCGAKMEVREDA